MNGLKGKGLESFQVFDWHLGIPERCSLARAACEHGVSNYSESRGNTVFRYQYVRFALTGTLLEVTWDHIIRVTA